MLAVGNGDSAEVSVALVVWAVFCACGSNAKVMVVLLKTASLWTVVTTVVDKVY